MSEENTILLLATHVHCSSGDIQRESSVPNSHLQYFLEQKHFIHKQNKKLSASHRSFQREALIQTLDNSFNESNQSKFKRKRNKREDEEYGNHSLYISTLATRNQILRGKIVTVPVLSFSLNVYYSPQLRKLLSLAVCPLFSMNGF